MDDRRLEELSGLTLFYASPLPHRRRRLLRQKRWAEYLTVVATASFIPLEIYEVCRHVTWIRVLLFAGNVAILTYLVIIIRKEKRQQVTRSRFANLLLLPAKRSSHL